MMVAADFDAEMLLISCWRAAAIPLWPAHAGRRYLTWRGYADAALAP